MKTILSVLLFLLPVAALAAPSPAAATLQIDVRGSMMTCFFGGYTFQATPVSAAATGTDGPPLTGTLHVGLGDEGDGIDPIALGGVFRATARPAPPLADGTCATPALSVKPDAGGRCWALSSPQAIEEGTIPTP